MCKGQATLQFPAKEGEISVAVYVAFLIAKIKCLWQAALTASGDGSCCAIVRTGVRPPASVCLKPLRHGCTPGIPVLGRQKQSLEQAVG